MGNYYEKLAELLNETLENGKIPESAEGRSEVREKEEFSQKEKEQAKIKIPKADNIPQGEVISMNQFAEYPSEIALALHHLQVPYPVTSENIKKQYHTLIKQSHPDLNSSESTQNAGKIISAYKLLSDFFKLSE